MGGECGGIKSRIVRRSTNRSGALNTLDPFNIMHLAGTGVMRNVTVQLPTNVVQSYLPPGLALGSQAMTPPGTHPVIMGFHNMYRLHASVPSLLPDMTYCEHSVGIPYCYTLPGVAAGPAAGPYFYMPRLFVNDVLAMLGGRMFWGYAKDLAGFGVDHAHFTAYQQDGRPIISLSYSLTGTALPIAHYPDFALQQQAISQPLISRVPLGVGPLYVIAGFPKTWPQATLQPLSGVIDIYTEYVPGLKPGRYPLQGASPGIDQSVSGGYVLCAPFEVGSPYPPIFSY